MWFTNQNSQLLEMEDRVNLTLVINNISNVKTQYLIEPKNI